MKNFIQFIVLISVLLLASARSVAGEWSGQQSPYRVYASQAAIYVQTTPSSAHLNPDNCKASSNYQLDPSITFFEEHFNMLMTALAAGRRVSLLLDGYMATTQELRRLLSINLGLSGSSKRIYSKTISLNIFK